MYYPPWRLMAWRVLRRMARGERVWLVMQEDGTWIVL
jgi:hypothetical protein